jgi:hypothetical protein
MLNETQDSNLLENGVAFLPWVGKDYTAGFRKQRLLVLGESHYDTWKDTTADVEPVEHTLDRFFTRECVQDVIERVSVSDTQFWKFIEQALLNEYRENGWAPNGGFKLWDQFAFYNFVQFPISGAARVRPRDFEFEQSRRQFRAVIEQLRPTRILVCGKTLWDHMEEINKDECWLSDDIQAYTLLYGSKVWCYATVHPSSGGYSWETLHPKIMEFLDDPHKAASSKM